MKNIFIRNKFIYLDMKGKIFKIAAISGSLKKTSTNTGLLRACIQSNNPHLQIQILDISKFPLFNEDV